MTKQDLQNQQAKAAAQLIAAERQLKAANEQYDALANALAGVGISESEVESIKVAAEAEASKVAAAKLEEEQKTPPASVS